MKHIATPIVSDDMVLNYHLMHPGSDSAPGDPNVAFCLDGTYHLHYILQHPWRGKQSYSFIHVTSPDMLHWSWQPTGARGLQPSHTDHGMFSGTGFITKEGRPAAIYAGLSEPRNSFITVAEDDRLEGWEKAQAVVAEDGPDGSGVPLLGDPDCFLIDDTYYAFSAVGNLPLCKSTDLDNWTYVGCFLQSDLPDVAIGEDLSCANFFPIGSRWLLLCISHTMGCRYYIGDWDKSAEQFVPEVHGRMNWRRHGQSLIDPVYRDFFAPESVRTPDGRRVMWAWLCTLHPEIDRKTVQSLPRELHLSDDGALRIQPLRELESLRYDPVVLNDITVGQVDSGNEAGSSTQFPAIIDGDSFEIRASINRREILGKRFGFLLYADGHGAGVPVLIRPESGTICVGETEAPFRVTDLPEGEDFELRIFVDKYLIEVFAAGRQAALTAYLDYRDGGNLLQACCFGGIFERAPVKIRSLEIWKIKPTNEGFLQARENPIWMPNFE